jgi:hypothetical protein
MIRNLGVMPKVGLIAPGSDAVRTVVDTATPGVLAEFIA